MTGAACVKLFTMLQAHTEPSRGTEPRRATVAGGPGCPRADAEEGAVKLFPEGKWSFVLRQGAHVSCTPIQVPPWLRI